MKAVKFKHFNREIAKDQIEYLTLPALVIPESNGLVITKWQLSFKERFRILFGRGIWLSTWTFGKDFQPIFLSTKRKEHFILPGEPGYEETTITVTTQK